MNKKNIHDHKIDKIIKSEKNKQENDKLIKDDRTELSLSKISFPLILILIISVSFIIIGYFLIIFLNIKYVLLPLIMSIVAGSATGIGGVIGVIKDLSMRQFDTLIGFTAGVMLSVATLGLIDEGLTLTIYEPINSILLVIIGGIITGMLFLLILDKVLPHLHASFSNEYKRKTVENLCVHECRCPEKDKWFKCPYLKDGICTLNQGSTCPKKIEFQIKMRHSGILLAIGLTLHNAPEGIAVGVGFLATLSLGFTIVLAITLHNIPEGIAVSMPLYRGNYSKSKSALIALLSGLSEPISCLIAVIFLQYVSSIILAFFLSFAGGAMIYVTSDELIPESHKHGYEHEATIGLIFGFILMLFLMIGFGV
ncbi:MAG: ZIP family metal transporter [Candidatus Helarchaeota archaeon]